MGTIQTGWLRSEHIMITVEEWPKSPYTNIYNQEISIAKNKILLWNKKINRKQKKSNKNPRVCIMKVTLKEEEHKGSWHWSYLQYPLFSSKSIWNLCMFILGIRRSFGIRTLTYARWISKISFDDLSFLLQVIGDIPYAKGRNIFTWIHY